jgi:succinate dehydrogenase / fumarate reductase cytochrome b subunit
MQNLKHLNPAVPLHGDVTTRSVVASHRLTAFWHTMIGKKVVMAVTGVVLIGFVIAHMLGNLKIFTGPDEINAYSQFLREVGWPGLGHGQLLWLVWIVLLVCVTLHITAAVQLTRMSRAARPVGYSAKRDIESTWAARTMRWGGVLLLAFVVFHLLHFTGGLVGFRAGQFTPLAVYQNVVAGFAVWPISV